MWGPVGCSTLLLGGFNIVTLATSLIYSSIALCSLSAWCSLPPHHMFPLLLHHQSRTTRHCCNTSRRVRTIELNAWSRLCWDMLAFWVWQRINASNATQHYMNMPLKYEFAIICTSLCIIDYHSRITHFFMLFRDRPGAEFYTPECKLLCTLKHGWKSHTDLKSVPTTHSEGTANAKKSCATLRGRMDGSWRKVMVTLMEGEWWGWG